MDDPFSCFLSLVSKIALENGNSAIEKPTIRLRPVIRSIVKEDAVPYILSIAEKLAFSYTGDSVSLLSVLPPLWIHLKILLKEMRKDVLDFNDVHSMSLDCLKTAVELCLDSTVTSKLVAVYRPWISIGLFVDNFHVVNRRRRQEDRWFATSDLLNYAGVWSSDHSKFKEYACSLSAVGVFDGHNGPEAAEHCSHLTPYLLSLGLHRQLSNNVVCITDLLVDVFHELNQSVNRGRANGFWSSGTTATVCILHGDSIYTAWVGDSQAWLVYASHDDDGNSDSDLSPSCADSVIPPASATSVPNSLCFDTEINRNDSKDDVTRRTSFSESSKVPQSNGPSIALTDTLHRPEYASEFVSVIRNGGMVTAEVFHDDASSAEIYTYAGTNSWGTIQATSSRSTARNWLNVPPLSDPELVECRVGGVSCVSRAIGDNETIAGLSALPSVTVFQCRGRDSEKPLCLILASDGLWDSDSCSGPEVAKRAQQWFRSNSDSTGEVKKGFAKELTQLATDNGASDNVTCVVLWMNCWKLDNVLKPKVTGFIGRKMQWPNGTRVTSLLDVHQSRERSNDTEKRRYSSSAESVSGVGFRYSSPPRYRSVSPFKP